jgi:hypothetical protein
LYQEKEKDTKVIDSVLLVGIWLVFLGIYRTDTGRSKTRSLHFGIIFLAGTPFFLERGVMAPFLRGPAPILRKTGFPPNLNSLTAMAIFGPQVFLASFKVNNFLNFWPLSTFDSSKCSLALQLE